MSIFDDYGDSVTAIAPTDYVVDITGTVEGSFATVQEALDIVGTSSPNGARVFILPGTYDPFVIPGGVSNLNLFGVPGLTIIRRPDITNVITISTTATRTTPLNNIHISGLTIEGNDANNTTIFDGIRLNYITGLRLENVRFLNTIGHGFSFGQAENIKIHDCEFNRCGVAADSLYNAVFGGFGGVCNVEISSCDFFGDPSSSGAGIDLRYGVNDIKINNNRIRDFELFGVNLEGAPSPGAREVTAVDTDENIITLSSNFHTVAAILNLDWVNFRVFNETDRVFATIVEKISNTQVRLDSSVSVLDWSGDDVLLLANVYNSINNNNIISRCLEGVRTLYTENVTIESNHIYECSNNGIVDSNNSGTLIVGENNLQFNGAGVTSIGDNSFSYGANIINNVIHDNNAGGVNVEVANSLVAGNRLYNNLASGGSGYAIEVEPDATGTIINDNHLYDTRSGAAKTQRGIRCEARGAIVHTNVLGGSVGGNDLSNLATPLLLDGDDVLTISAYNNQYNDGETQYERRCIFIRNTSGAQIEVGQVLVYGTDPNSARRVTGGLTSIAGIGRVLGVAAETIPDGDEGLVIIEGFASGVHVNGATAITSGTLLGTGTTLGVARAAAINDTAFGICVDPNGYAIADNNGRVDVYLFERRQRVF